MPPSRLNLLSSIKPLPSLIYNAHSTRWPGASSFAIFLLCLCLVISVAQFAVIVSLGIKLLQIDSSVPCQKAWVAREWVKERVKLPITFVNKAHSTQKLSMGENTSKFGIIYTSILTPTLILTLLTTLGYMHFRKRGVSNRTGVLWSFLLMCLLFVGTIQDAWLGPDREEVVVGRGYTICWRPDPEFDAIKRERKIRWGLGVGSEVFSGLGALCMACYLALALSACRQNAKHSAQSSTRMQDLLPNGPRGGPSPALYNVGHPQSSESIAAEDTVTIPHLATKSASMLGQYGDEVDGDLEVGREREVWTPLSTGEGDVFHVGRDDDVEKSKANDFVREVAEDEGSKQRKDSKD